MALPVALVSGILAFRGLGGTTRHRLSLLPNSPWETAILYQIMRTFLVLTFLIMLLLGALFGFVLLVMMLWRILTRRR